MHSDLQILPSHRIDSTRASMCPNGDPIQRILILKVRRVERTALHPRRRAERPRWGRPWSRRWSGGAASPGRIERRNRVDWGRKPVRYVRFRHPDDVEIDSIAQDGDESPHHAVRAFLVSPKPPPSFQRDRTHYMPRYICVKGCLANWRTKKRSQPFSGLLRLMAHTHDEHVPCSHSRHHEEKEDPVFGAVESSVTTKA